MTYKIKGEEVQLPLTVEAIEDWITEQRKYFDLEDPDNPANLMSLHDLRARLYRDVMIVISTRAGHAVDLAEAALKLEKIYV